MPSLGVAVGLVANRGHELSKDLQLISFELCCSTLSISELS